MLASRAPGCSRTRAIMRYFLLDRVTERVPGERARGLKNVTLTDEVVHDHFPDIPILPGALVVEAAAQLAGFLLEMTRNRAEAPLERALLVQIKSAKFYRPAQPGDRIDLVATLGSSMDAAAEISCEARVEGERSMRATLTFMMRRIAEERVHEQRRRLYRIWTRGLALSVPIL